MPCRNIIKTYNSNSYYHIYNRGVEKRKIFIDDQDYAKFESLLKRYLSNKPTKDSRGRSYIFLGDKVSLIAFCLMPNHFHMIIYQTELDSITKLLRSVCSSYVTYFNNKYNRVGTLFQGNFKAIQIKDESYLLFLTRYIHRNPADYLEYEWSSLNYWLGKKNADWLDYELICDMSPIEYLDFIKDDREYYAGVDRISKLLF
jgi:putative transposase